MIARITDWWVVHAIALLVFGRVVETFSPTLLGLPSVVIFGATWFVSLWSWAHLARREPSLREDVLAFCIAGGACYGAVFGGSLVLFGTHWTESLRKVGPYFGAMLAMLGVGTQAAIHIIARRQTLCPSPSELRTGVLYQIVGVALYFVKRNSSWLAEMGSGTQLALVYLVIVCPAFWYTRFLVSYVRAPDRRKTIVAVAAVAALGSAVLAF
jgi:hypothetical protein